VVLLHPRNLRTIYHSQPIEATIALEWVSGLAARNQYAEQENAEKSHGAR